MDAAHATGWTSLESTTMSSTDRCFAGEASGLADSLPDRCTSCFAHRGDLVGGRERASRAGFTDAPGMPTTAKASPLGRHSDTLS